MHSVAIRYGECDNDFAQQCQRIQSPIAIFLDRAYFCDTTGDSILKFTDYAETDDHFQHIYQLEPKHPLLDGLPRRISIYGRTPIVTPLRVESGMEILVSLDGIPVIALQRHRLFIGVDPWQLGHPSAPMLYQLLSNWLIHKGKIKPRKFIPIAAIRLDDLPVTAENLRANPPTKKLDRTRCKILKRLRRFARRRAMKFTLMYSSHFPGKNGILVPISSVMPRSIRQMQLAIKQQVFEFGSHGMVHLRSWSDLSAADPREFSDLDTEQTIKHLESADGEIIQLFGKRPRSFVAPAWGYRPGVTKRVAAERYPIVIDSSQHVETGLADVFGNARQDDRGYFNMVETVRSGDRMLSYSSADFWRCYAAAGIPVHYMQHTDTNWHLLRNFLKAKANSNRKTPQKPLQLQLFQLAENTRNPRWVRAFSAIVIGILHCSLDPVSWKLLWLMLTRSSLYAIVRAMNVGGYQCVSLSDLTTLIEANQREASRASLANCNRCENSPRRVFKYGDKF